MMANIRVSCPTCKAELEIDSQYAGQEVECGSCLQVFVAKDPTARDPSGRKPYKARRDPDEDDDKPRRKKKPRRRDYDDDYGDYADDYDRPAAGGGGSAAATFGLVLGIISLPMACCCWPIGIPTAIAGMITSGIGMKNPQSKGTATAGMVLSVLAIVLVVAALVVGFGANLNNPGRFWR